MAVTVKNSFVSRESQGFEENRRKMDALASTNIVLSNPRQVYPVLTVCILGNGVWRLK